MSYANTAHREGMTRRALLALLTGAAMDPDRLLWQPGRKLISIPKPEAVKMAIQMAILVHVDWESGGGVKFEWIDPTTGKTIRQVVEAAMPTLSRTESCAASSIGVSL